MSQFHLLYALENLKVISECQQSLDLTFSSTKQRISNFIYVSAAFSGKMMSFQGVAPVGRYSMRLKKMCEHQSSRCYLTISF